MRPVTYPIFKFDDGTRIAATAKVRAQEMYDAGLRNVIDHFHEGSHLDMNVVDSRAERVTFYVEDGGVITPAV